MSARLSFQWVSIHEALGNEVALNLRWLQSKTWWKTAHEKLRRLPGESLSEFSKGNSKCQAFSPSIFSGATYSPCCGRHVKTNGCKWQDLVINVVWNRVCNRRKTLAQIALHKKLAPKLVPWANLNMFFLRSMILSRPSGNHILKEKVFFIRKVLSKLRLCNLRERELLCTFFCMTLTCDSFAYLLCGLSGHVRAPQMLPLIFLNHALKAGSNGQNCVQHFVLHIFTLFTLFVSSAGKGTQCHQSGTSHLHQWPRSKTASAERKCRGSRGSLSCLVGHLVVTWICRVGAARPLAASSNRCPFTVARSGAFEDVGALETDLSPTVTSKSRQKILFRFAMRFYHDIACHAAMVYWVVPHGISLSPALCTWQRTMNHILHIIAFSLPKKNQSKIDYHQELFSI